MAKRMILFAPAALSLLAALAAVLLTTQTTLAQHAADDCVTRPGSAGPSGTHWYYRLDRANGRQCWYLGAAGTKVASTPAHVSPVSALRLPSPRPSFMSAGADSFASAAPLSPIGERSSGGGAYGDAAASFAQRWPRSALSPSAVERTRVALAEGTVTSAGAAAAGVDVDGSAAGNGADGLPLVWPVLTADERAAARVPYQYMTTLDRLLAIIASALALGALAGQVVLKRPAANTERAPLATGAPASAPGRRVRAAGPLEARQSARTISPAEARVSAPARVAWLNELVAHRR